MAPINSQQGDLNLLKVKMLHFPIGTSVLNLEIRTVFPLVIISLNLIEQNINRNRLQLFEDIHCILIRNIKWIWINWENIMVMSGKNQCRVSLKLNSCFNATHSNSNGSFLHDDFNGFKVLEWWTLMCKKVEKQFCKKKKKKIIILEWFENNLPVK